MMTWALESAVAVSILIVAVLVARRPVARAFGAHAAYALWAAPPIRAIMPPLPTSGLTLPASTFAGDLHYRIIVTNAADPAGWSWTQVMLAVWLAGASAYLAVQLLHHHRFIGRALARGRALPIEGLRYDVIATPAVEGPLASGLIHPVILVPDDFRERFTAQEQHLALLHEQLHHRRGDIWASATGMVITALLWFNPLAHLALSAFRRDMEAACDASVLRHAGPGAVQTYAATIVRCATRPVPRSLCALTSIEELKGRLTMLTQNHGPAKRSIGVLLAGLTAVAGMATASAAEEKGVTQVFEKKVVLKGGHGEKDVLIEGDGKLADAQCPGEKFEAGAASGDAKRKEDVKFVLCAAKGESLLAALQKAEADVQKQGDMPGANKAEILKQIRAKIAELQARG